jgi:hypothetical protein
MLRASGPVQRRAVFTSIILALSAFLMSAPSASLAQQGTAFDSIGYLQVVDPVHNRITFQSGSSTYVVDMKRASVHLPALSSTPGETGDLVVGMRVEVVGVSDGGPIVRATKLQVLPYIPPGALPVQTKLVEPAIMSRSGTIYSYDIWDSSLILAVGGHNLMVHLSPTTTIQSSDGLTIKPSDLWEGDNVSITGTLAADGSLSATTIVRTEPSTASTFDSGSEGQGATDVSISGQVTSEASLFSRDIRVQTPSGEVKITVPKKTVVVVDGKRSSVHDLKSNFSVIVWGTPQPDGSFLADKITSDSSAIPQQSVDSGQ